MQLLSVRGSKAPQLAVRVAAGVLALAEARAHGLGDASGVPMTLDEALREPGGLDRVRQYASSVAAGAAAAGLVRAEESVRVGLPYVPRSIIAVGLNYEDHAREGGHKPPAQPILFAKLPGSVIGPGDPIVLPPDTAEVDYEAELAVVIGRRCRSVGPDQALDYVAGYMCMNDVSARDFQRADGQFVRAKSQDTFGPMGPGLVTADEIPDPQGLAIRCLVNGRLLQDSHTSRMIFPVRELIAFISRGITLEPGDVIATGTPHGVGFARTPPIFLQDGDEVVVEIERVGRLVNPVRGGR